MLQITRQTEYAVRSMMALDECRGGKPVQLKALAETCHVSEVFLAKILQELVHAGVVKSHRGVKGGFCINRPSNDITFLEIVEICEGKIELNHCLSETSPCPDKANCNVAKVWENAQAAFVEVLKNTKLSDVL